MLHPVDRDVRTACAVASVAVGLATVAFRLAAFNGFENDHFMHLAWSQQLLLGEWPGRDFVEPGMPLVVGLSALAQLIWPGFLSEALLSIAMVGIAAGFTCTTVAMVARSIPAGMVAGLVVAVSYPRLYSYPKLLVPAVALWLVVRHARQPSTRGLWLLAAWAVVAFLLRHDLGVVTAGAVGLALALDGSRRVAARAGDIARFVGMGLLIVSPYLAYVALVEGLAEHVRVGLEFGKSEQDQALLGLPDLTPEEGGLQVVLFGRALSPEALLLWMYSAVGLALTVLLFTSRGTPELPPMVALWFFTVAFRVVILRHPLRARLPDVAVVAAMGGAIAAVALLRRLPVWWRTRPAWAVAATAVALAFAVVTVTSLWTVVNLSDRLAQAGFTRGAGGAVASARDVLRRGAAGTWERYWPAGEIPPVVDYLTRCTTPADHLLITWFAPEYFLFAGRPFAAGQSQFFRESFATERDQAVMLARIRNQSVPFVLVNEADRAEFSRAFPRVSAFIDATYTVRAHFPRDEDTSIAIAVRNDLRPRTSFGDPPWVCGKD